MVSHYTTVVAMNTLSVTLLVLLANCMACSSFIGLLNLWIAMRYAVYVYFFIVYNSYILLCVCVCVCVCVCMYVSVRVCTCTCVYV